MTAHTPPPPVPDHPLAEASRLYLDGTPEQQQAARRELIAAAVREQMEIVR